MMMMGSAGMPNLPQPLHHHDSSSNLKVGPITCHVIKTAVSLRISHFLRRRLYFSFLSSSFKDSWQNSSRFEGLNILDSFRYSLSSASSCYMGIIGRDGNRNSSSGKSELDTSRKGPFDGRGWTNTLLIINVVQKKPDMFESLAIFRVFITQLATKGKLLLLGAKINSLIDQGQLWRLATSSLLHVNIGHLMVNCYSLNSIGPAVEKTCGPRRYLVIYFASAIACSAMSYWLNKSPAVGASGAIFGLVGSFAVFILRHRSMFGGGKDDLQHIARVIVLNMAIGLMFKHIDNWGHLGGLLGGVATSWLIGPAWKCESLTNDGRKVFLDKAPIFYLINTKHTQNTKHTHR